MKQTQPYQNRIHVFHVTDGKIWTFQNEMEACRYTNNIQSVGNVGEHFNVFYEKSHIWDCDQEKYVYQNNYYRYDVIMRDDYGEIVTIGYLVALWNQRFRKPYRYTPYIPGTKRSRYGWYRHLKTTNERRQAVDNWDAYDEYGIVVRPRGSRGYHGLPNSWDDYHRTDTRSWKKHRKTQWR